jgi:hypothetical protein
LRVLVSERLLRNAEIEIKPRTGEPVRVPRAELTEAIDTLTREC